jgi:protein SCO1/2
MRRPQLTRLLLSGLAVVLVAGFLIPRLDLGFGGTQMDSGLMLDPARPLRNWPAPLLTEDGQAFGLSDFEGAYHLLFFGFASCPDICPNTLLQLARVYRDLPAAVQERLNVVLISVDPERDSPAKLRAYVKNFHTDFRALTGPEDSIADLAAQAGIAFMKVDLDEGYTVDHSAALVMLNPQAQIQAYFAPPLKLDSLQADLSRLVQSRS